MSLAHTIAGMAAAEARQLWRELIEAIQTVHREADHLHEQPTLAVQIGFEERAQRRVKLEQSAVEEGRGTVGDRPNGGEGHADEGDLLRCHGASRSWK
jgi:hypothetical protein